MSKKGVPEPTRLQGSRLRFLVLADLHFRAVNQQAPLQTASVRSFLETLRCVVDDWQPDILFLLGDVAWSGKKEEYQSWLPFFRLVLEICQICPERCFPVPGNHDVNRLISGYSAARRKYGRASGTPESLYAIWQKQHETLLTAQASWRAAMLEAGIPITRLPADSAHYVDSTRVGDQPVLVAGINTAVTAWGGPEDQGRIRLPRWLSASLKEDLAVKSPGDQARPLTVLLTHHPWHWMADHDWREARQHIQALVDIHLSGHTHQAWADMTTSQRVDENRRHVWISAPAVHDQAQHPNGFIRGEFVFDTGQLWLYPHRWSAEFDGGNGAWLREPLRRFPLRRPPRGSLERGAPEPGERVGRYLLLEFLGYGGIGRVYRARVNEGPSAAEKAVKIVHESNVVDTLIRDRILCGWEQAISLRAHPNILDVDAPEWGAWYDQDRLILPAEYVGRRNLALEMLGGLTPAQAHGFFEQMADALAHAHERGTSHGDLSPANVLLYDDRPDVVLGDFDLSSRLQGHTLVHDGGRPGAGKLRFASPEVLEGQPPDQQSDQYSLAVLLLSLLLGRPQGFEPTELVPDAIRLALRNRGLGHYAEPLVVALRPGRAERHVSVREFAALIAECHQRGDGGREYEGFWSDARLLRGRALGGLLGFIHPSTGCLQLHKQSSASVEPDAEAAGIGAWALARAGEIGRAQATLRPFALAALKGPPFRDGHFLAQVLVGACAAFVHSTLAEDRRIVEDLQSMLLSGWGYIDAHRGFLRKTPVPEQLSFSWASTFYILAGGCYRAAPPFSGEVLLRFVDTLRLLHLEEGLARGGTLANGRVEPNLVAVKSFSNALFGLSLLALVESLPDVRESLFRTVPGIDSVVDLLIYRRWNTGLQSFDRAEADKEIQMRAQLTSGAFLARWLHSRIELAPSPAQALGDRRAGLVLSCLQSLLVRLVGLTSAEMPLVPYQCQQDWTPLDGRDGLTQAFFLLFSHECSRLGQLLVTRRPMTDGTALQ